MAAEGRVAASPKRRVGDGAERATRDITGGGGGAVAWAVGRLEGSQWWVTGRVVSRRRRQDAVGGGTGGGSVRETVRGAWRIASYHGVADENGTAAAVDRQVVTFSATSLSPRTAAELTAELSHRIFPCWPPFSSHRQTLNTRGRAERKWEQPMEQELRRRWVGPLRCFMITCGDADEGRRVHRRAAIAGVTATCRYASRQEGSEEEERREKKKRCENSREKSSFIGQITSTDVGQKKRWRKEAVGPVERRLLQRSRRCASIVVAI